MGWNNREKDWKNASSYRFFVKMRRFYRYRRSGILNARRGGKNYFDGLLPVTILEAPVVVA